MKDNEFLRSSPSRKKMSLACDMLNYFIPIFSCVVGFWISTQIFANLMNYDVRVVGYPLYIFKKLNNYRLYNPFIYILAFLKFAFKPGFGAYFYASLMPALSGTVISFISILAFAIFRNVLKKSDKLYGTARWATEEDLEKFALLREHGIVEGQIEKADIKAAIDKDGSIKLKTEKGEKLICHSGKTNTLLIAPTRSGKGVSVIIPSLLNYSGSVIVFDPKGENWNITAGFRKKFSNVLKFSPLSKQTIKFNPMDEIRSGDYAFADANQIADILYTSEAKADSTSEYFNTSAKDITTGVILHVKFSPQYKEKNLSTVLSVMSVAGNTGDSEEENINVMNALVDEMINTDHEDEQVNKMVRESASRLTKNPKERASVMSTAFSKLQLFEDPLIANAVSCSDFKISDFIENKNPISLYLTVPYAHIMRISLVFRLLINFMLRKFSEGETQYGEIKLKNHLVFFLDEFRVLGRFPFIAEVMGILAGYGVTFVIVCQAINQLVDLYGENHPFLDHCKNVIVFAPGKVQDAKAFTDAIGKESVLHDSVSTSGRKLSIMLDNLNLSTQEVQRDLINPDELMKLPPNRCLIMNQGMPPYIAKKCVYYDDERFKDKAFLKAPMTTEELLRECQTLPSNKNINLSKREEKIKKEKEVQLQKTKKEKERQEYEHYFEPLPESGSGHFFSAADPELVTLIKRLEEKQNEQILHEDLLEDSAMEDIEVF